MTQEAELLAIELRDVFLKLDIPFDYIDILIDKMLKTLSLAKYKNINKKDIISNFLKHYFEETFNKNCNFDIKKNVTTVVGIFGANGSGKTLFTVKLANFLQKKYNKRVLCLTFSVSSQTARQNLRMLCKDNKIDYLDLSVFGLKKMINKINEIIKYKMVDAIIIDDVDKVQKIFGKNIETFSLIKNFSERIVVIDSMSGQNISHMIKKYNKTIDPTGFVVSKVDCNNKCGVYFSIANCSSKPIYFVSSGEKIGSIYRFNKKMINNVVVKEDCLKHIMKNSFSKKKEYEKLARNHYKKFNYDDMQKQLIDIIDAKKNINKTVPLFASLNFFNVDFDKNARCLVKKWISIILSMTKFERLNAGTLSLSRVNRIANGAGVCVNEVLTLQKKIKEINKAL